MNKYLRLIRIKHWVKNILIFLPAAFDFKSFSAASIMPLILGFFIWGMAASIGYIINDLQDVTTDRKHHIKRNRPIASGEVSAKISIFVVFILLFFVILSSIFININGIYVLIFYSVLNFLYSNYLKRIRFVDLILLTLFYLLRICFGAELSNTPLTNWFMVTSCLVFLSLALNKRKLECILMKDIGISGRGYQIADKEYLNIISILFAGLSLILMNLHMISVLKDIDYKSIVILNLTGAFVLMSYFDDSNIYSDDPVEKLFNNRSLIISGFIFFVFYLLTYYFH